MPLEIRELTIKATVEASSGAKMPAAGPDGQSKKKDAEVNFIVEKVLKILKERSER